jgi:jumonji domain-containing protein 2
MDNEIQFAKIFRPTMEEFADFNGYMEKLEKTLPQCGIYKVVPPKKWKPNKLDYSKEIEDLIVSSPIEQNVYGKGGIYELLMIQKKSMRVHDYKKKVDVFDDTTTNKSVEEVEDAFWRTIAFSPPLYGADIKGSLFDENVPWDLKNLPGVLSDGLRKKISGVNEPYLYFGSWKTLFSWHKEDMDLYSINYLHTGKPKFWYSLPREESPKFEHYARQQFPEAFSKCKEYLRHKTVMISPYVLKQKIPGLKIHKMIQNPGEFVITMGGAYHCGFNWGFNVAEAVNFAITKWLDLMIIANPCTCTNDSVKIDRAELLRNIANLDKKNTKGKKMEIEDEPEKTSSSTKSRRKSTSDADQILGSSRRGVEVKPDKNKIKDDSRPKRGSKRNEILSHPILNKKPSYEPKSVKETRQKDKENLKVQQGSKKIKKISISPKGKNRKNSQEKDGSVSPSRKFEDKKSKAEILPGDTDNMRRIRRMIKAKDNEEILFENWICCDECGKWRKMHDENLWNKLQGKTKILCKNLPGASCSLPEENWKQSYYTVSEKVKNNQ